MKINGWRGGKIPWQRTENKVRWVSHVRAKHMTIAAASNPSLSFPFLSHFSTMNAYAPQRYAVSWERLTMGFCARIQTWFRSVLDCGRASTLPSRTASDGNVDDTRFFCSMRVLLVPTVKLRSKGSTTETDRNITLTSSLPCTSNAEKRYLSRFTYHENRPTEREEWQVARSSARARVE